ncbi:glycosyltransferase family 4 protein [Paenibacillus pasadenensis]|uniref:glycosyltransferase family 4 protein n=1 Tax=Paenibacillus pasadenensis TaxID=217090 RepID=UPI00203B5F36|nr:glycosyltransferase family 4 protein [Paenibacillus pasadenensis]MCM3748265.1 glycosyltransferase family 4 protein [Paenibacillus pasadenensis]
MKPLVLLTDAYGGHGGIAKFNRDLLGAICTSPGLDRAIAIPRIMPHPPGELPSKLDYVTSGLNSKQRYLRTVLASLFGRAKGCDLIVCGHINLLPFAALAKKITGAPIALIIHGIDAWDPVTRRGTAWALRQVDAVISVSQLTLERFTDWSGLGGVPAYVLPNSFEPGLFTPGPRPVYLQKRYGLKPDEPVIMTLGRLAGADRRKGFDEVLEALPRLRTQVPRLRYLIVGDGSDRTRLEEKAKALGVADSVVFTGMISEEEKADHYRLADGFAMPSHGEGFGIVLLEAMACGVPAMASLKDGSSEALMHGRLGELIDPADPGQVVGGIIRLLEAPRGTVPEELGYFSYANYTARLHGILERIGSDTKAAPSGARSPGRLSG